MSGDTERQGHCLCGAVTITAANSGHSVGACHCAMCRRWCSGPLMAIDCGTDPVIGGEENLAIFDSSPWAERGFCRKCGSSLFYRLKGTGQYQVSAGVFDEVEDLVFEIQVFVDERPSFYRFANETREMTGAEIFAKYGPS